MATYDSYGTDGRGRRVGRNDSVKQTNSALYSKSSYRVSYMTRSSGIPPGISVPCSTEICSQFVDRGELGLFSFTERVMLDQHLANISPLL